jgi:hypothetical protein
VRALSSYPTGSGSKELTASADGSAAVGDAGRAFQAVRNAFELLAFAVETGVADRATCDQYLKRMGTRARGIREFIYDY